MASQVTSLTGLRARGIVILVAIVTALVLVTRSLEARLVRVEHATGVILFIVLVALAAFGARKKVSFLPLGTAAQWLRVHLALGVIAIALLAMHAGFAMPNGVVESLLAALFVLVSASGILGVFVSRSFARRLSSRGQEVIWERIPALRARIREQAEHVVRRAQSEHRSTTIAEMYEAEVASFLSAPANFLAHVLGSEGSVHTVVRALEASERYANDAERELTRELRELVVMKDDLDFHWALQGVLKGWLFVHVPATGLLLLLALVHGIVAHAFVHGAP